MVRARASKSLTVKFLDFLRGIYLVMTSGRSTLELVVELVGEQCLGL